MTVTFGGISLNVFSDLSLVGIFVENREKELTIINRCNKKTFFKSGMTFLVLFLCQ